MEQRQRHVVTHLLAVQIDVVLFAQELVGQCFARGLARCVEIANDCGRAVAEVIHKLLDEESLPGAAKSIQVKYRIKETVRTDQKIIQEIYLLLPVFHVLK